MKIRVLMSAPFAKKGGVSNHAKALQKCLTKENDVVIIAYNSFCDQYDNNVKNNIIKTWRRSIGFIAYSLRKRRDFDIIHTQSSGKISAFLTAIIGAVLSRILDKKFLITFHYSKTDEFIKQHHKLFKLVISSCDRIILVSDRQKTAFVREFGNDVLEKIVVIPNGFDPETIHPVDGQKSRESLGIPLKKKVLLNIAALEEYKGQEFLIMALNNMIRKNKDLFLIIIGEGSLFGHLQKLIIELKLRENVNILKANKTPEELNLYYNGCDIFILPSLSEGNPTVLFECLGAGKPFIGTRVGGIPEVIRNERIGLLCEPGDIESLTNAIEKGLVNKFEESEIIELSNNYTWSKICKKTIIIYNNIIMQI